MRRPRYKGKNPKRPSDKYKELDPEKYPEEIAKIIAKGRTPLGTHIPIMLEEILNALAPLPGHTGLDLTLGYGGHAQELLKAIGSEGKLIGVDQDPIELKRTTDRLAVKGFGSEVFLPIHMNFRNVEQTLKDKFKFDFVFADLGLSSMQIDRPERGFSIKHDSPLDFRMDPSKGLTALEALKQMKATELANILMEYADEPFPHELATGVLEWVKKEKISTTKDLKESILECLSKIQDYPFSPDKTVTRVFQAIRVHINQELDALDELLSQVLWLLKPKAKLAFLSFHSGEDRQIKKFFKLGLKNDVFAEIHGPIKATEEEINKNRRARSAKLRWATLK